MGLSADPLGSSLFGEDALGDPPVPRDVRYPVALKVVGATMAAELGTDGLYAEVHPVDAKVALAVLVAKGRVATLPTLGSGAREIDVQRPSLKAEVEAELRSATAAMVAAGELRVERVEVETSANGYVAALYYTNLQLRPSRPARAAIAT